MATKVLAGLILSIICCFNCVIKHQFVLAVMLMNDSIALTTIMHYHSKERIPIQIPMTELPDGPTIEERVIKGLAYVPLIDQPIHSIYAKEGFPGLKDMFSEPAARDGSKTYSAIPNIGNKANKIYFLVPLSRTKDQEYKDLRKYCDEEMYHRCSFAQYYVIVSCEIKQSSSAPTELLDMFGFIPLQLQGRIADVLMQTMGRKILTPAKVLKDFKLDYTDEREHPRILWPAWVNMYLFFRNSFHVCTEFARCKMKTIEECANFFTNVNQLSLTYAYFVCRILSGNASDSLCPEVCRFDPCATIQHAIPGTCYPINLKIHRNDYFCFCKDGYVWETRDTRDSFGVWRTGRCMEMTGDISTTEYCTPLELETFCNPTGTKTCIVNRSGYNRKAICMCKTDFANLDCGYQILSSCDANGFKGSLRCRTKEGVGTCRPDIIDPKKYNCQCTSTKHIRWIQGGYEECRQLLPSLWYDRSKHCGYDNLLMRPNMLHQHCNTAACTELSVRAYMANIESAGHACGGLGVCSPSLLNLNTDIRTAYCQCKIGRAGRLCSDAFVSYVVWTPWTVCYDKGQVVTLPKQRARLRFRNCQELKRVPDGKPPICINGETEQLPCPDVATDLDDVLTYSDYGVTSQAVISMWRVVELMVLVDMLLIGMLTAVLLHHRYVLSQWGVEEPTDEPETGGVPRA